MPWPNFSNILVNTVNELKIFYYIQVFLEWGTVELRSTGGVGIDRNQGGALKGGLSDR